METITYDCKIEHTIHEKIEYSNFVLPQLQTTIFYGIPYDVVKKISDLFGIVFHPVGDSKEHYYCVTDGVIFTTIKTGGLKND